MITSAKKLLGEHEENLGKWVKVTPDEEDAIRESLVGANYERGAAGKPSLRLYSQGGHVVICSAAVQAEPHPSEKKES